MKILSYSAQRGDVEKEWSFVREDAGMKLPEYWIVDLIELLLEKSDEKSERGEGGVT
jgi:hypothetical protein